MSHGSTNDVAKTRDFRGVNRCKCIERSEEYTDRVIFRIVQPGMIYENE